LLLLLLLLSLFYFSPFINFFCFFLFLAAEIFLFQSFSILLLCVFVVAVTSSVKGLWVLVSVVSSGSLGKVECGSGLDYFEYLWLCDLQDRVLVFGFLGLAVRKTLRGCVCVCVAFWCNLESLESFEYQGRRRRKEEEGRRRIRTTRRSGTNHRSGDLPLAVFFSTVD
jgi:hypothetical protein